MGVEIVRRALQAPARYIAQNAGAEGSVIVGKLMEGKDDNVGYDAKVNEFTDMIKAGVIDPTKVVRAALQNAASVAGLWSPLKLWLRKSQSQKNQCQLQTWAAWVAWAVWVAWASGYPLSILFCEKITGGSSRPSGYLFWQVGSVSGYLLNHLLKTLWFWQWLWRDQSALSQHPAERLM